MKIKQSIDKIIFLINHSLFKIPLIVPVFWIQFIYSQELPNIVPPSPEASALSNFTNVPVSHYTGLPNISIPIYTIKEGNLDIPIQLSYHARGVQVSEIAPRTGMGWSLQYGGSISRQVRGRADEGSGYSYLNNAQYFTTFSTNIVTRNNVNIIEQNNPDYDFYPDQFTFSTGNNSGKFVLNYVDGQPIVQSFGDLKVEYEMAVGQPFTSIGSFKITDSEGNIFYFGKSKDGQRFARDYQISNGSSVYTNRVENDQAPASGEAYSSWKLLDVETSTGKLISYHYNQTSSSYLRKAYDKHDSSGNVSNSVGNVNNISAIHSRVSNIANFENELKKITYNNNNDSIVFNSSQTTRQDYNGYALETISIYHKNDLIKSFDLNYNYTTSTDQSNLLWYFQNNFSNKYKKRLFLNSIVEKGKNGEELPAYIFTYNSQVLPSIFSSRQDYLGYYNGASNNGPFTRMFEYGNYTPNRRVDTIKAEAGLLKEIQYPTGGTTKLTYEHNKGYIPQSHSSLKIPDINPAGLDEVNMLLRKEDFTYNSGTGNYSNYILQNLPAHSLITYRFDCMHFSDPFDPNPPPSCLFEFTVNGQSITIGQEFTINTGSTSTNTIGVSTVNWSDPDLHRHPHYDFQIRVKYSLTNHGLLYGPGKRIKRIETISENGVSTFKEFEYSIGGIIGLPSYINTATINFGIKVDTHYNDTGSAYSSFQQNSIGYSDITEYQGTKNNNTGKISYTFTNISDSGGDYYEFPYHPPTDNEWLRGKNVRTRYYKNLGNNNYSLMRQVYNKYLYSSIEYADDYIYPSFYDPSFVFTPEGLEREWSQSLASNNYQKSNTLFRLPLFMQRSMLLNSNKGYRIYYLTGGTQHLLHTEVTDYSGSVNHKKTTTYSYDYDHHYQISSSSASGSDSPSLLTRYWYPENVASSSSLGFDNLPSLQPIDTLKKTAGHRLSEVIQTASYTDLDNDGIGDSNELISALRTNYSDFNGNTLPSTIQALKGVYNSTTNKLETRIEYLSYDSFGNPTEVKKSDGASISYLWGYNGEYVLAKVENATQAEIIATGVNQSILTNPSSSDANRATELNKVRNGLPNAMVTTYEYRPLVGVTKITDPRGEELNYDYDNFNRLEAILDDDLNLLEEYEYNYKSNQF